MELSSETEGPTQQAILIFPACLQEVGRVTEENVWDFIMEVEMVNNGKGTSIYT